MLKINDKEYKVLTSEIKYVSSTVNNQNGFTVLVNIDLEKDNIKGYISFYVDYFKEKTIKNIENKKYIDLPTELNSKISMIEIFDTKNFIDFIDSEVTVEFGRVIDDKIETKIFINDELIKVEYQGLMDIK